MIAQLGLNYRQFQACLVITAHNSSANPPFPGSSNPVLRGASACPRQIELVCGALRGVTVSAQSDVATSYRQKILTLRYALPPFELLGPIYHDRGLALALVFRGDAGYHLFEGG